jgi:hypothetical protein
MSFPVDLPEPAGDPGTLAERRARRAELAESDLRARLEAAGRRVAELEHAEREHALALERLAARARRDAVLAEVVAGAAAAIREVRRTLDLEIARREAAEAAVHAERAAREAAEATVVAERAARDAAVDALTAERSRPGAAPPRAAVRAPGPAPAPAPPAAVGDAETDRLVAGLALAAERLRAQAPPADEAPVPAAPAAPPPPPAAPALRRSGGLLGALLGGRGNGR